MKLDYSTAEAIIDIRDGRPGFGGSDPGNPFFVASVIARGFAERTPLGIRLTTEGQSLIQEAEHILATEQDPITRLLAGTL